MEDSTKGILALIGMIILGIFGFIRNQSIKDKSPEKANYVDKTWQDAPKGMRVSGYDDKEAHQYFNGKGYIVIGIMAFIVLVIFLLKGSK